ncbi:hypothetical protein [Spartinivicinus poritis]|nr:hypothetical protein [Spartinivicinus sp. A2-2]
MVQMTYSRAITHLENASAAGNLLIGVSNTKNLANDAKDLNTAIESKNKNVIARKALGVANNAGFVLAQVLDEPVQRAADALHVHKMRNRLNDIGMDYDVLPQRFKDAMREKAGVGRTAGHAIQGANIALAGLAFGLTLNDVINEPSPTNQVNTAEAGVLLGIELAQLGVTALKGYGVMSAGGAAAAGAGLTVAAAIVVIAALTARGWIAAEEAAGRMLVDTTTGEKALYGFMSAARELGRPLVWLIDKIMGTNRAENMEFRLGNAQEDALARQVIGRYGVLIDRAGGSAVGWGLSPYNGRNANSLSWSTWDEEVMDGEQSIDQALSGHTIGGWEFIKRNEEGNWVQEESKAESDLATRRVRMKDHDMAVLVVHAKVNPASSHSFNTLYSVMFESVGGVFDESACRGDKSETVYLRSRDHQYLAAPGVNELTIVKDSIGIDKGDVNFYYILPSGPETQTSQNSSHRVRVEIQVPSTCVDVDQDLEAGKGHFQQRWQSAFSYDEECNRTSNKQGEVSRYWPGYAEKHDDVRIQLDDDYLTIHIHWWRVDKEDTSLQVIYMAANQEDSREMTLRYNWDELMTIDEDACTLT